LLVAPISPPVESLFLPDFHQLIIWIGISPSLLSNSSLSLIGYCSTMISQSTSPSLLLVSCFFFVPINEHATKSHANEKATGIHLNKYGLVVQCSSPHHVHKMYLCCHVCILKCILIPLKRKYLCKKTDCSCILQQWFNKTCKQCFTVLILFIKLFCPASPSLLCACANAG
jgi:hypothetical protein